MHLGEEDDPTDIEHEQPPSSRQDGEYRPRLHRGVMADAHYRFPQSVSQEEQDIYESFSQRPSAQPERSISLTHVSESDMEDIQDPYQQPEYRQPDPYQHERRHDAHPRRLPSVRPEAHSRRQAEAQAARDLSAASGLRGPVPARERQAPAPRTEFMGRPPVARSRSARLFSSRRRPYDAENNALPRRAVAADRSVPAFRQDRPGRTTQLPYAFADRTFNHAWQADDTTARATRAPLVERSQHAVVMMRGTDQSAGSADEGIKHQILRRLAGFQSLMVLYARKISSTFGIDPTLQHPDSGISYNNGFCRHTKLEDEFLSPRTMTRAEGQRPATRVSIKPSLAKEMFKLVVQWAEFATQFSTMSRTSWDIAMAYELQDTVDNRYAYCELEVVERSITETAVVFHEFIELISKHVTDIVDETVKHHGHSRRSGDTVHPPMFRDTTPLPADQRVRADTATFGVKPYQGTESIRVPLPPDGAVYSRFSTQGQHPIAQPALVNAGGFRQGHFGGDPGSRAQVRFQPNRPNQAGSEAGAQALRVDALRQLAALPEDPNERAAKVRALVCLRFYTGGDARCPGCNRAHVSPADAEQLGLPAAVFNAAQAGLPGGRRDRA